MKEEANFGEYLRIKHVEKVSSVKIYVYGDLNEHVIFSFSFPLTLSHAHSLRKRRYFTSNPLRNTQSRANEQTSFELIRGSISKRAKK